MALPAAAYSKAVSCSPHRRFVRPPRVERHRFTGKSPHVRCGAWLYADPGNGEASQDAQLTPSLYKRTFTTVRILGIVGLCSAVWTCLKSPSTFAPVLALYLGAMAVVLWCSRQVLRITHADPAARKELRDGKRAEDDVPSPQAVQAAPQPSGAAAELAAVSALARLRQQQLVLDVHNARSQTQLAKQAGQKTAVCDVPPAAPSVSPAVDRPTSPSAVELLNRKFQPPTPPAVDGDEPPKAASNGAAISALGPFQTVQQLEDVLTTTSTEGAAADPPPGSTIAMAAAALPLDGAASDHTTAADTTSADATADAAVSAVALVGVADQEILAPPGAETEAVASARLEGDDGDSASLGAVDNAPPAADTDAAFPGAPSMPTDAMATAVAIISVDEEAPPQDARAPANTGDPQAEAESGLAARLEATERERSRLVERVAELEAALQAQEAERVALEGANGDLTARSTVVEGPEPLDIVRAELESANEANACLQRELHVAQTQALVNADAKQQQVLRAELKTALMELHVARQQSEEHADTLERELRQARDECDQLTARVAELQAAASTVAGAAGPEDVEAADAGEAPDWIRSLMAQVKMADEDRAFVVGQLAAQWQEALDSGRAQDATEREEERRRAQEQAAVLVVLNEQLQEAARALRAKELTLDDMHALLARRNAENAQLTEQLRSVTTPVPAAGMSLPQLAARASLVTTLHTQVSRLSADNARLQALANVARGYEKRAQELERRLAAMGRPSEEAVPSAVSRFVQSLEPSPASQESDAK